MEKTPIISRTRAPHRRNNLSIGISIENESKTNDFENDDSPVHIACTQEGCENVDVVWDWNSPQAKHKPKRLQKRLLHSPKIPLRRHPSNNHIQNFEKLQEELQLLREEISVPEHEESLVLSPLEEAKYKDISDVQNKRAITLTQNYLPQDDQDLFNDSVDEQLVLFSQKLESDLNTTAQITYPSSSNNCNKNLEIRDTNKLAVKADSFHGVKSDDGKLARPVNDSFDSILQEFKLEVIEEVMEIKNGTSENRNKKNYNHTFPRARTESEIKTIKHINKGKVEFHRTQSFESFQHSEEISQSKLYEIERKRKEALAKLGTKRKQDSPLKCTPEEIERKRLQALAKLEAKRQQDSIERKRQEALKRLELSRKKNAMVVKSSLTKRL